MIEVSAKLERSGFALDVDVACKPGVIGLFGPSGSGKTTLARIIAGFEEPQTGEISFDCQPLYSTKQCINLKPHLRRVGYVFQDTRLFPHLTVGENISYGLRFQTSSPSIDFEELVSLLDLDGLLSKSPAALSGGEAQRVGFARAVMAHPKFLILDEPLSSLDQMRKYLVLKYLEKLKFRYEIPMLYITHDPSELFRIADSLVILESGKSLASAPLEDALGDPKFAAFLGVDALCRFVNAQVQEHLEGGLTRLSLGQQSLILAGLNAPVGARVRVRIPAQDVILAKGTLPLLSARNQLTAEVTDIQRGHGPGALITLSVDQQSLLVRVTAQALNELSLAVGDQCYALLKTLGFNARDVMI
ncbi:MAG: molybdenum ABC transporter ATP-binding protein [Pseudomonadota bacterium]